MRICTGDVVANETVASILSGDGDMFQSDGVPLFVIYSVLQCVIVVGSMLQVTFGEIFQSDGVPLLLYIVCCSVLRCVAVLGSALQVILSEMFQSDGVPLFVIYSVLQCVAVCCSVL